LGGSGSCGTECRGVCCGRNTFDLMMTASNAVKLPNAYQISSLGLDAGLVTTRDARVTNQPMGHADAQHRTRPGAAHGLRCVCGAAKENAARRLNSALRDQLKATGAQAAAFLAAGTSEIVFRICEAIW